MTDYGDAALDEAKSSLPRMTYSDVAAKLLQDNFLLTALELHTELVESGREVPQLKEFFSNPGNFERPSIDVSLPIARSPSQATLDSLDLARLSEDGERSSDVAVLEFELRKARETISSLRANLTQATELDTSSADIGYERLIHEDIIKPHEKRALNFLINEYLMQQDYKLTSITFSDEIPEQDFEDWDDVGLNIPRPAGLVALYRGDSAAVSKDVCHSETQTEESVRHIDNTESMMDIDEKQDLDKHEDWESLHEEITLLKKQILALETDKLNYQKLYDAALASLNSLSSPTSDMPSSETTLYALQPVPPGAGEGGGGGGDLQPLPSTATQNYYGSSASTHSLTPDQFEMIDSDKNGSNSQKDGSNTSWFEPPLTAEEQTAVSPEMKQERSERKESITTIEDSISLTENPETDWGRGQFMENAKPSSRDSSIAGGGKNEAWINSSLPSEYKSALLKSCNIPQTKTNELLNDMAGNSQAVTLQRLVYVVSATLPKIVPNVLLVKRDEVIGLLVCTIFLHPEQSQRDKLLQILLNLRKKMEKEDRALIISGLVLLLQWNMETNSGLDSDLLGMCWEMLNSKSAEKRLLGAEASIALAPYISLELVSSLLLSMVVSMCESADSAVRAQGLLGMLLICPVTCSTKHTQLQGLLTEMAQDRDADIAKLSITALAPVLARNALINGYFHSEMCSHLLNKLKTSLNAENKIESSVAMLGVLNSVITTVLVYVVNTPAIKEKASVNEMSYNEIADKQLNEYFVKSCFTNPKFLMEDSSYNPFQLINIFYDIMDTNSDLSWPEKDWFISKFILFLVELLVVTNINSMDESVTNAFIVLFESICVIFGANFTKSCVKPLLEKEIQKLEQRMAKLESQNSASAVIVSVYLAAILPNLDNEEPTINAVMKRWSICSGMCGVPSSVLGVPIVCFSHKRKHLLDIALGALWESVVHTSEQVRSFVAGLFSYLIQHASLTDAILNARVIPAVVTLVSDSTVLVKCSAMVALGAAVSRNDLPASARDKCWLTLEGLAREERAGEGQGEGGGLGHRGAACLAHTLALLMQHGAQHNKERGPPEALTTSSAKLSKICEGEYNSPIYFAWPGTVLPNLTMLCYSPIFSSTNVSAINELLKELLPALQLGTQGDCSEHFIQNVLLPALRNLEHLDSLVKSEHKSAIEALIHKVTTNSSNKENHGVSSASSTTSSPMSSLPGLLTSPESVGRRVTQMFHSKPAMNLQNIFKKKT